MKNKVKKKEGKKKMMQEENRIKRKLLYAKKMKDVKGLFEACDNH